MTGTVMLASGVCAVGLVTVVWLLSIALHDVSVIDVAWGLGFVAIGWVCFALGHGNHDRRLLLAVLVTAWGLRLAGHIGRRNAGKGEDRRYAAMRARDGGRFVYTSFYRVFLVQAVAMWIVSLPLQAGGSIGGSRGIGVIDIVGIAVWAVGFGFESIGDLQLDRFKADPANRREVMDRGLWRYTRHPNYFGDVTAWWGIGIVALGAGDAWWALIGPAVNTLILTRGTGKPLLESTIGGRRPGYADYVQRTSGFVPLPPRRRARP
jgi:steroid 5-alpha reductase family enzyme